MHYLVTCSLCYVLVIRRKDDGLTDIVSNEARRAEFDTISVRPSSFQAYNLRKTLQTTNKAIIIITLILTQ